ncbi:MAG TPA: hypothetical protein VN285_03605 [Candidatus Deferrimicrobium sp.]|nr:hypothetical protein [Candidatus Deferrimicrobium sp.]
MSSDNTKALMHRDEDDDVDLVKVIIQPLYFGMVANILIPMVGLFICYYINNRHGRTNMVGDLANTLFFVFGALALVQAGIALYWRHRRLGQPMIRTKETIEEDIAGGLLRVSRIVLAGVAAISLWGFLYFYLTGRFRETVAFVLFSFVVFQLVRPRHGSARRLVSRQRALFEKPLSRG